MEPIFLLCTCISFGYMTLNNICIICSFCQCNSSIAVLETLKYITNPISSQSLIAIIGGGCSPATNALIDIAEYQNIPLVKMLMFTISVECVNIDLMVYCACLY